MAGRSSVSAVSGSSPRETFSIQSLTRLRVLKSAPPWRPIGQSPILFSWLVYLVRTNIFYFGRGASVRVWRRPHLHLGRPTPPTSAARRSSGRNSSTRPTTPTGATPAPPFGERGVRHHHIKRESATDHVTGSEAGLLTGNRDYSASAPNRCRQCCAFVFASWWTVRRTGTTVRGLPRTE